MTWSVARQGATACKAHIRPRPLFKCKSTTVAGLTASRKVTQRKMLLVVLLVSLLASAVYLWLHGFFG
jgi:hypothetical protein